MPRKLFTHASTRARVQHEVDDELRFHLDARTDELIRAGRSPDDARRIALQEYGDVSAARAELASIDRRRVGRVALREWIASWTQDVRFALRGLRTRPAFSATVVATIALGIGINVAIFSVVDGVLLRPLPFANPDRLVHLWETYQGSVSNRSEASYPDYLDWRARNKVFADIAGYHGAGFLLGGEQPATVGGAKSTANFFDVLGVRPILGRSFVAGEDAVGAPPVALLSYGFWKRQFVADSNVLGRTITLNGTPVTVIGVLPESFMFARQATAEIWTPIDRRQVNRDQRGNHWVNVVGRLKPGVTPELAASDMRDIMKGLSREYPRSNTERSALVIPLHDELVGSARPVLLLVYGAVMVVLLVACVNVANLLLIRGADRHREIAVRIALGAGRGRLMRQLLTESVVLAVVGGVLSIGVANVVVRGLMSAVPSHPMRGLPPLTNVGIDGRVIIYAMLISLAAGIGFGIVPSIGVTRAKLHDALKQAGRGAIGASSRLRDALVVGEIALTVVLLSGALLFGRSMVRLLAIDPGFKTDHLLTTTVVLPATKYATAQSRIDAFHRLEQTMREIPGVEGVGFVGKLPLDFGNSLGFSIVGDPAPAAGHFPEASYRPTTADYFRTAGIPIVAGEGYRAANDTMPPSVAVANRALVATYFGDRNPVGQRISLGNDTVTIVGVAGDVPIGNIDDKVPPTLYFEFARQSQSAMAAVIRTSADAGQISASVRRALSSVDADAAFTPLQPMTEVIAESPSVFMRRFPLVVIGTFALAALLLAMVGIYGVVSYSVAQRTREMGIRMALGASPRSVVGLVVRHGATMAALGIVLGVAGSIALGRSADRLLYGVRPSDPITYVSVAVVLAIVAVAATILPARRATRVDPALALRAD